MGLNVGQTLGQGSIIPDSNSQPKETANNTFKCPNCKNLIDTSAKFCPECGTKIIKVCPKCNSNVNPGQKFCPECGEKLYKIGE